MNHRVRALLTGIVTADSSVFLSHSLVEAGKKRVVPLFIFYVEGSLPTIVEVGGPPAEQLNAIMGTGVLPGLRPCQGGGPESVSSALASVGVNTADIKVVIPTHLHFDHCWNLEAFPKARVIVQRDEVVEAIDPAPHMRVSYRREMLVKLVERRRPDFVEIIDGDMEVAPGIAIIKTPGHTSGSQTVIVETDKGKVAINGQAGGVYENWFPADARLGFPRFYMKDSYHVEAVHSESVRTYLQSMKRIAGLADIVMPTHEWRIPKRVPEQWWFLPPNEICQVDWNTWPYKPGVIEHG